MPFTPISKDQWAMLSHDNVVAGDVPGIAAFDVRPVPLATVAPEWLVVYRKNGRFNKVARA